MLLPFKESVKWYLIVTTNSNRANLTTFFAVYNWLSGMCVSEKNSDLKCWREYIRNSYTIFKSRSIHSDLKNASSGSIM